MVDNEALRKKLKDKLERLHIRDPEKQLEIVAELNRLSEIIVQSYTASYARQGNLDGTRNDEPEEPSLQ